MIHIFRREFFGYFRSPVAYVFLAVFVIASIGLTWLPGNFFDSNDASMQLFFTFIPWVYLFLIPAVGMRLWAEEKRSGTWELLLTLPISTTQAVMGKFLAGLAFLAIALLCTFGLTLTTAYLGDPDWGPIFTGYIGCIFLSASYLSICSLTSALTKSQVISFVLGVTVCVTLLFLGWGQANDFLISAGLPIAFVDSLANFSIIPHFEAMVKGLITLQDIVFFVSLSGFALFCNILILER